MALISFLPLHLTLSLAKVGQQLGRKGQSFEEQKAGKVEDDPDENL